VEGGARGGVQGRGGERGRPLLFGPADDRRGLVLEGVTPRVVRADSVSEKALWVHDVHDTGAALVLASLESPEFPIPIGVLAEVAAPRYEETILAQEQRAIAERGPGEIAKLLVSGDTWKIG